MSGAVLHRLKTAPKSNVENFGTQAKPGWLPSG